LQGDAVSAIQRSREDVLPAEEAKPRPLGDDAAWSHWQQARLEEIDGFLSEPRSRSTLLQALNGAIRSAIATGRPAAAILLDLNNFAEINAAWGPAAGDETLQESAARLGRAVEQHLPRNTQTPTTAGRLDADHFIVCIPMAPSLESLKALAAELVRALSQPLVLGSQTIAVSARAAIVQIPSDGRTVTSILGRGFRLLNGTARGSATGVAVLGTAGSEASSVALERDLATAIATDQLFIALQPKVEAKTGIVRGAEALARWRHPERGLVAPPAFIEAAERSGLIFDLGLKILRHACRARAMLSARNASISVAVNVSAHQLSHPDFLARFLEVVDLESVDPKTLEIEVTETAAMMGGERVLASLHALRRCGIGIAIDDFGTGFSNLASLGTLPADVMKIDRSLVIGLDQGERAAALLDIALQLGRTFGLTTVAEGVETAAQFEKVKDLGCDLVQGFFTGRPVAAGEFADRYLGV
jgi:diguanylate cyclase (GGDEF)-like protein